MGREHAVGPVGANLLHGRGERIARDERRRRLQERHDLDLLSGCFELFEGMQDRALRGRRVSGELGGAADDTGSRGVRDRGDLVIVGGHHDQVDAGCRGRRPNSTLDQRDSAHSLEVLARHLLRPAARGDDRHREGPLLVHVVHPRRHRHRHRRHRHRHRHRPRSARQARPTRRRAPRAWSRHSSTLPTPPAGRNARFRALSRGAPATAAPQAVVARNTDPDRPGPGRAAALRRDRRQVGGVLRLHRVADGIHQQLQPGGVAVGRVVAVEGIDQGHGYAVAVLERRQRRQHPVVARRSDRPTEERVHGRQRGREPGDDGQRIQSFSEQLRRERAAILRRSRSRARAPCHGPPPSPGAARRGAA